MPSLSLNSAIHLAGFGAGIVLYGLLAMMTRPTGRGGERLSFATAILGLAWNTGALVTFGAEDLALGAAPALVTFVAYSALGFLPAVAVHAAAGYQGVGVRRRLYRLAYALAAAAAAGHLVAWLAGAPLPSREAMLMLTVGNLALVGALVVTSRIELGARDLSSVALAVFAVMALHLGQHADVKESWVVAVLGHHASLPLALAILYHDYRFAFADVFLRRALSLIAITIMAALLLWGAGMPLAGATDTTDLRGPLLVLGLWVATAVVSPWLMRVISRFVDRVLLRRQEPRAMVDALASRVGRIEEPTAVLDAGTAALAAALSAQRVHWRECPDGADRGTIVLHDRGLGATVHIPTTETPCWDIEVGELAGGRRLLSGDGAMLEAAAQVMGRRIDAVRMARERLARDLNEESLRRLSSEAELQALRAQLNPHFLFNALTTLGFQMSASPRLAQETLYSLTALLRAVLTRTAGEQCALHEEMALVRDYLAIERARFEERLDVRLDVPEHLTTARIPSLLLQPLVENAIKHGIAPLARGGLVEVTARLDGPSLVLTVHDTGLGTSRVGATGAGTSAGFGVGLSNLERRLARLYGQEATILFESAPGDGTTVEVRLPFRSAAPELLRVAS